MSNCTQVNDHWRAVIDRWIGSNLLATAPSNTRFILTSTNFDTTNTSMQTKTSRKQKKRMACRWLLVSSWRQSQSQSASQPPSRRVTNWECKAKVGTLHEKCRPTQKYDLEACKFKVVQGISIVQWKHAARSYFHFTSFGLFSVAVERSYRCLELPMHFPRLTHSFHLLQCIQLLTNSLILWSGEIIRKKIWEKLVRFKALQLPSSTPIIEIRVKNEGLEPSRRVGNEKRKISKSKNRRKMGKKWRKVNRFCWSCVTTVTCLLCRIPFLEFGHHKEEKRLLKLNWKLIKGHVGPDIFSFTSFSRAIIYRLSTTMY